MPNSEELREALIDAAANEVGCCDEEVCGNARREDCAYRASAERIVDRIIALLPQSGGGDRWRPMPDEPTREMWAAAGDAVVALQARGIAHHDKITEAVWTALRDAAPHPQEGASVAESAAACPSDCAASETPGQSEGGDRG